MCMWTRKEIKRCGRAALAGKYWLCVLMCLVFSVLGNLISTIWSRLQQLVQLISRIPVSLNEIQAGVLMNRMKDYMDALFAAVGETMPADTAELFQMYTGVESAFPYIPILLVIAAATWIVVYTFAYAHFQVGYHRFFLNTATGTQKISDIGYAFSADYLNVAKVMLVSMLITSIGFCLFIIPGIILSYQLIFVPYLLAENPHMKLSEALRRSTEMTRGNKFKIFVFGLSFIGWRLLSTLCLCGLGSLFLTPYILSSYTQLYLALRPEPWA